MGLYYYYHYQTDNAIKVPHWYEVQVSDTTMMPGAS